MLLEDRDREVDDLRSLLADREGRIQQLVQDLHQRHDGGEGVFWQQDTAMGQRKQCRGPTCCLGAAVHTGPGRVPASLARQQGQLTFGSEAAVSRGVS